MAGEMDTKVKLMTIVKDFISVRSFITLGAFGLAYVLIYKGIELPSLLTHIIDILLGCQYLDYSLIS